MTMLKPGKMKEIAEQMLRTQLQIIALQEIRWKGHGQIKNTYSLYYSYSEQTTGYLGTGFVVKEEIEKSIMCFTPINEIICKIRLKGKFHNIILIKVRATTEEKTEEEKDKFYDDLQRT
jgi:exonuclease III